LDEVSVPEELSLYPGPLSTQSTVPA